MKSDCQGGYLTFLHTASSWFIAALVPMAASQFIRLQQVDPLAWIFWDYAGRVSALVILLAIPAARTVAFQKKELRISLPETIFWVIGLTLLDLYFFRWAGGNIDAVSPQTVLGKYPVTHGSLYYVDVVFGLALVAYHEEIVFRRCARHLFQAYLGDGHAMVVTTSLLFGAYHWWTGLGNISEAFLAGMGLMLFYRRAAALWPVVFVHYLIDLSLRLTMGCEREPAARTKGG